MQKRISKNLIKTIHFLFSTFLFLCDSVHNSTKILRLIDPKVHKKTTSISILTNYGPLLFVVNHERPGMCNLFTLRNKVLFSFIGKTFLVQPQQDVTLTGTCGAAFCTPNENKNLWYSDKPIIGHARIPHALWVNGNLSDTNFAEIVFNTVIEKILTKMTKFAEIGCYFDLMMALPRQRIMNWNLFDGFPFCGI